MPVACHNKSTKRFSSRPAVIRLVPNCSRVRAAHLLNEGPIAVQCILGNLKQCCCQVVRHYRRLPVAEAPSSYVLNKHGAIAKETPRAAVQSVCLSMPTLILLDADPKAPGSIHLARPSSLSCPLGDAQGQRPVPARLRWRILRPTRSRLSLQCCTHDTASSGHAGQLGASQAGGSENARHRSRVVDCVGCRATVLGCGGKQKNRQIASQRLRSLSSRRTATRHQPLRHCLSQVPAWARRARRAGSFLTHRGPRSRPARTSRSKPLCALQHCLGTCGF